MKSGFMTENLPYTYEYRRLPYLKTNLFLEAYADLEQTYVPIYLPMVVRVT
jgi:hypothetical protein